jgi:hypothetical protein
MKVLLYETIYCRLGILGVIYGWSLLHNAAKDFILVLMDYRELKAQKKWRLRRKLTTPKSS